jgi:hypothetical protein
VAADPASGAIGAVVSAVFAAIGVAIWRLLQRYCGVEGRLQVQLLFSHPAHIYETLCLTREFKKHISVFLAFPKFWSPCSCLDNLVTLPIFTKRCV